MTEFKEGTHPFQDQSFRFADADTSRSSEVTLEGIPKAQTLNDFDWEAQEMEPVLEESSVRNSVTELLVSKEDKPSGDITMEDCEKSRMRDRMIYKRQKTEQVKSPIIKEKKKRRDFREALCDGLARLLDDITDLINGRTRDAEGDEVEYGPIRYVPHSLSSLTQTTKFTKEELKSMYRTFKNECPSGVVYEDTFKSIYSQFFPSGDSNMYAHYLFNAFDDNQEGYICFEDFVMSLSSLLRGKFEEKLQWIFKLYDINHDGFITKEEMQDIVKSVYSLTGSEDDESSPVYSYMEHANRVFRKLDQNNDGYVTYPEFVEACSRDPTVVASLKVFETAF
ncbi:A-type potassium channel modulatory protein KCNIP1-like isoform X1 [Styela clava]